ALVETGERKAVRVVLCLVPARAEPELDAAARDVVDGRAHPREHRRTPEGRRRDHRAQPDPFRHGGEPGECRPGVERAAAGQVEDRLVVVGAEETLETVLLAGAGERNPVVPGDALLALDHQADAHSWSLRPRGPTGPQ